MGPRQRIIETASRLFYNQGYNSTGINQVIKEAKVAKASLYQHFPSKEDLLIEYLKISSDTTNKALNATVEKQTTPKEKVLSLFDFLITFSRQNNFQGCNFLNVAAEIPKDDEKVKALIRQQKNNIRSLLSDILKPLEKQNLADELYLLFDAALISSKVYGDVWPIKTARAVAKKLL